MTRRGRRTLIALACTVVVAVAALAAAGEYLSSPVLHGVGEPPSLLAATPVSIPVGGVPGAHRVSGWVARGAGSGAVLLLHGVRSDRRQMAARALWLNRLGYTVLLIDLASHGESPGKRITFGAHEAAGVRSALDWLRRNLPGERIGVIGVSLGGASLLLSNPGTRIDALVLESVYPTIGEAVVNRLSLHVGPGGALLAPLLLSQIPLRTGVRLETLRPVDAMARVACPVFVIGGALDVHTSADETRRMYAAAKTPKELWLVDGAAHVDLHAYASAAYEHRVGAFMDAHLRRSPAAR